MRHPHLAPLLGCLIAAGAALADDGAAGALRVLTWNIHAGRGMDGRIDLDRIAAVIREADADLVALQEVDQGTRRSGHVDQPAELARRLPGHTAHFAAAMPHDGGAYGVCVLSRLPVRDMQRALLPNEKGREPRVLLVTVVEWHSNLLMFATTHLDNGDDDDLRIKQVEALATPLAPGRTHWAVLAGDFNAEPGAASLRILQRGWQAAWPEAAAPSYPADVPRVAIDHVFVRAGSSAPGLRCEVLPEALASDHRPVRAVIPMVPARLK